MKKLGILLLAGLASSSFAQNIVASYSQYGTISASAQAFDYRYTRGGSPRTGFYWYWRQYTDQILRSTSGSNLNSKSVPASVTGTFYQPTYPAKATGWALFSNTPTSAIFKSEISASDDFELNLLSHQAANASASATESFTFTITSPSLVSIALTGSNGTLQLIDNAANEAIFSAGGMGTFSDTIDPGTYTIKLTANVASSMNTQSGVSLGLGLNSALAHGEVTITGG